MSPKHLPLAPPPPLLPTHHARWLPPLLGGHALDAEPAATCDDCAMVSAGPGLSFDAETKCCTFTPGLPNFLVGAALRAGGLGADTVRARVARGLGLGPLGLVADAIADPEAFGRDRARVCPHLSAGQCSIWAAREATCATWYCKHARGAVGKAAWNRVEQLMQIAERAVALHAALALGIPALGLARATPLASLGPGRARHDLAGADEAEALWGPWAEQREAYFLRCDLIASTLAAEDVERLGGSELAVAAHVVRHALGEKARSELPARATLGRVRLLALGVEHVRVQSYSYLDPLDLPRKLFDVLHCFDGRPLPDAIAAASRAAGEPVPEAVVRMLLDHELLAPA